MKPASVARTTTSVERPLEKNAPCTRKVTRLPVLRVPGRQPAHFSTDMTIPLSTVARLFVALMLGPARLRESAALILAIRTPRGSDMQQAAPTLAGCPTLHHATNELERYPAAGSPPTTRRTPALQRPPPRLALPRRSPTRTTPGTRQKNRLLAKAHRLLYWRTKKQTPALLIHTY
jgi:hypothetical protein